MRTNQIVVIGVIAVAVVVAGFVWFTSLSDVTIQQSDTATTTKN